MNKLMVALAVLISIAGCTRVQAPGNATAAHGPSEPATPLQASRTFSPPTPTRKPAPFAALPDLGELVAYDTVRAVRRTEAHTWYPVQLSEAHARRAVDGQMMLIGPQGQAIRLHYRRHVQHPDGNWTWTGIDDRGADAVLTFGPDAVFGSIPDGDHGLLRLTMASAGAWLVTADRNARDAHETGSSESDFLLPAASPTTVADESAVSSLAAAAQAAPGRTMDLVLGYTAGFAAQLGGDSQARTRLHYLVDLTNVAYANSVVDAGLRLVHAMPVAYTDDNENKTALEELTGSSGSASIPVPAALAPLRAARDQYAGDLVALVRPLRSPQQAGCGIAWLIGGNQSGFSAGDAPYGYSVVGDGSDLNETDGRTYFCRDESLAHELGHNMGQAHNIEDSGSSTGAHSYSYGYRQPASNGFYTIMAYRSGDAQFPIRYFSNPNVFHANGPTGVQDVADNARSMNDTVPIVANFRVSLNQPLPAAYVRADMNGDGMADIVWRNTADTHTSRWFMNGPVRIGGALDPIPPNYHIVGIGDFDADYRSDLLWQNGTNLIQWRPNAAGTYMGSVVSSYADAPVVGVSDMNGDRTADIVLRSIAAKTTTRWLMNGSTRIGGATDAMSTNYRVVGVGDFDGDGRGDLLWADTGNTHLLMWRPDALGRYVGNFVDYIPPGWEVVGVADMNGDRHADIIWRNTAMTQTSRWFMDGPIRIGGAADSMSPNYRIVGINDFDGDGRNDLLWMDSANTHLLMWRPNAVGVYKGDVVANVPSGWLVVNGGY